jgi:arginine/lysine/ornithine decarboxylase
MVEQSFVMELFGDAEIDQPAARHAEPTFMNQAEIHQCTDLNALVNASGRISVVKIIVY